MPPPSPLAIATSALNRLVKEEKSYYVEIASQEEKIKKLEEDKSEDENAEYQLNQWKRALQQSRDVLPPLREKINESRSKLETLITEEKSKGASANTEEITKAEDVVDAAKNLVAPTNGHS